MAQSSYKDYLRGVNYPSNMLWAAALEAVADLYDDPALTAKSSEMKKTICSLAWNGEFFEDNAIRDDQGNLTKTGHTTETCQYYAFYFDTAKREDYPALFEKMLTQFGPKRDATTVIQHGSFSKLTNQSTPFSLQIQSHISGFALLRFPL